MRILHLCLCGPVTDGWTYQDNLLSKYHRKAGHEVTLIASQWIWGDDGKLAFFDKTDYVNEDGVKIIRLPIKKGTVHSKFKRYIGLYDALEKNAPEVLFIHGCQFLDMPVVVKFLKKHSEVAVYLDNHADFSNSATNWLSKNLLHKILWRSCAQKINPYVKRCYGVLPARVDFLANVYGLPKEKIELLVMGADDESVKAAAAPEVRQRIRQQYGLNDDDFVIITGGKIDAFKTQTLLLMEAVQKIEDPKVRLVVFGSVAPELKEKVAVLADGTKVQYIGWVQAKDSYDYFAAADLVVFPGRHSVFWEQVAAQGIPLLVKRWDGTMHTNVCGNTEFLEKDSAEEIYQKLTELLKPQRYAQLRTAAGEASGGFLYSKIAEKSISDSL